MNVLLDFHAFNLYYFTFFEDFVLLSFRVLLFEKIDGENDTD